MAHCSDLANHILDPYIPLLMKTSGQQTVDGRQVKTSIPLAPSGLLRILCLILLMLMLGLTSCQPEVEVETKKIDYDIAKEGKELPYPPKRASVALGKKVYIQNCRICHIQLEKTSEKRLRDPNERPLRGWAPAELYQFVSEGQYKNRSHTVDESRKRFRKSLTVHERWGVVFYIMNMWQENVREDNEWTATSFDSPDWLKTWDSNLRAEKNFYGERCSVCHGDRGLGDGPEGKNLLPPPRNFTDLQWMSEQTDDYLFGIIKDGKIDYPDGKRWTGMPPWSDFLTEHDMWTLVGFIRSLTYDMREH